MGTWHPPKAKFFWLLLLLIFGIYFKVYIVIQQERAINSFYIIKNLCTYSPHKNIVFFTDERSMEALKSLGISVRDILEYTNKQYLHYKLPIRFNNNLVHIRKWQHKDTSCAFLDGSFINQRQCIVNELGPKISAVREIYDPDVIVFLTSSNSGVYAKSFWRDGYQHGNGVIVINLGYNSDLYKDKPPLFLKKAFIMGLSQILLHELGHLYGLDDFGNSYSIMSSEIMFGSPKMKFHPHSLNELKKFLENLKQSQEDCAAH